MMIKPSNVKPKMLSNQFFQSMSTTESILLIIGMLLILTLFEFGGDWFFTNNIKYFWIGVLCYTFIGIVWGFLVVYRKQLNSSLAIINAGWQILSIIAITILSRFVLNEPINIVTAIGLGICCLGIGLVVYGGQMENQH